MRRNPYGRSPDFRRRAMLSVDAAVMVEGYLRERARAGRLKLLMRSREALMAHYRAQGNDVAVYCLASAPDFSPVATYGGGARLVLRRNGAAELAGSAERFRALDDDKREALTAQEAEEVIRRQRER